MEEYTTKIQSKPDLSDVYFMTCLESASKDSKEIRLAGPATTFMLAVTLAHGIGCYAADSNMAIPSQEVIPQLFIQTNQQNWSSGHWSTIDGGKMSIEVNRSYSYRNQSRKNIEKTQENLERAERIQIIKDSYTKNKIVEPRSNESEWVMKMANTALCQLPFNDAIVQYDSYDDVWQYNLFFKKDLELSVSVYVDGETIGDVDFNIYHDQELLVANMMPLKQLVRKMITVISKV